MGIFSKNPRISFPVNMSPKVQLLHIMLLINFLITTVLSRIRKIQLKIYSDGLNTVRFLFKTTVGKSNQ